MQRNVLYVSQFFQRKITGEQGKAWAGRSKQPGGDCLGGRPCNLLRLTPPGDTISPAFIQPLRLAGTSEVTSNARTSPAFIPRLVAAAMVFALLSASVPVGALTSAHLCAMACCAGHAPHLAGSCSGGSCHARLSLNQGSGFLPLHGERDEEYQFGLTVPVKGWTVDTDYFHTRVKNFFDHNALGNSNIFFPLTIERARIRAIELTMRSPMLLRRGQVYLAYSRQKAEGQGTVTGGLTDFSPPADYFLLDHDQRNTLSAGFNLAFLSRSYIAGNVRYGSGFTDAGGPGHLPGHRLVDLSVGRAFGEDWSMSVQALNITNRRFLLDNSNTFGGTHFIDPREVYVELRYRLHY